MKKLFFDIFFISPSVFEALLSWICSLIRKKSTRIREFISASERLCVTMRYLVTGDAQATIATNYRMSLGRIISETCKVIWQTLLSKKYINSPSSEEG